MRMTPRFFQRGLLALALAGSLPVLALAQTAPAPANPVPAAPTTPAPGTPGVAQPTPTQPDQPVGPSVGETVTLEAKPALTLGGESSWDSGFETLVKSFQTLNDE